MAIFDLSGKISLDSAPFMRGLKQGETSMKDFMSKISSGFESIKNIAKTVFAGAIVSKGIDAVKSLAEETAAAGDAIDKQSQQLGMSRKAYQEWEYILSQSGASIETMGASMNTLSRAYNSTDAEMKIAFSNLHLSTSRLKKMKPEEALETVVRAFQKLPPSARKSELAVKLFGGAGRQLMPLLNSSKTSIDEFRDAMKRMGLYMSDDAVDASVAYGDALDDLKRTFNSIKYSIGTRVLPTLTNAFKNITDYASKIKKAYEKNGLTGVFKTLASDIKNIQWPTWKDVEKALTDAWETIKKGATGLGGIVFGKKKDGSVDWPTWTEVGEKAGEIWNAIKDGAKGLSQTLGGIIFGKKEDGSVDWPDKDALIETGKGIWRAITDAAKGFGGVVFGKEEDGSVAWPKLSDILTGARIWWTAAKAKIASVMDKIAVQLGLPPFSDAISQISDWWNNDVWGKIKDNIKAIFGFEVPSVSAIQEQIRSWWESVKSGIALWLGFGVEPTGTPYDYSGSTTGGGSFGYKDVGKDQAALLNAGGISADTWNNASEAQKKQWAGMAGFEKGLWEVPYNDFPALLHEGEMVLTRSQARDYKEGKGQSLNLSNLMGGIVSAIKEGMRDAQVNAYMDGKRITRETNRITANELRNVRFAR